MVPGCLEGAGLEFGLSSGLVDVLGEGGGLFGRDIRVSAGGVERENFQTYGLVGAHVVVHLDGPEVV